VPDDLPGVDAAGDPAGRQGGIVVRYDRKNVIGMLLEQLVPDLSRRADRGARQWLQGCPRRLGRDINLRCDICPRVATIEGF
jgi:hypothetical protein